MIGKTNASGGGKLAIGDITQDTKYVTDPNFVQCQGQTYTSGAVYDGLKDKLVSQYNGLNYTTITVGTGNINDIVYSAEQNVYVAVCSNGSLYTSTNGASWTARSTGIITNIGKIVYGKGIWAFYSGKFVYTSTDLITWTQRTTNFTYNIYNFVFGNDNFILTGGDGTGTGEIRISSNAVNWTLVTTSYESSATFYSIGAENGTYVIPIESGRIIISTNLTSWTQISAGTGSTSGIGYNKYNGLWYLGSTDSVYTSSNLTSWVKNSMFFEISSSSSSIRRFYFSALQTFGVTKSSYFCISNDKFSFVSYNFSTKYSASSINSACISNDKLVISLGNTKIITQTNLSLPAYKTNAYIKFA